MLINKSKTMSNTKTEMLNKNVRSWDNGVKNNENAIQIFKKFLYTRSFRKGRASATMTHTALFPFQGSFALDHTDFEMFWKLYTQCVEGGVELGITEVPQEIGSTQFVLDIDIAQPGKDPVPLHTEQDVKEVVGVCFRVLNECIEPDKDVPNLLQCIYLNKKPYRNEDGKIKHGFHLQFPHLFLPTVDIAVHVFPRIKEGIKKANLNTIKEENVDNVTKTNWLLYGSSKDSGLEPYRIAKFFRPSSKGEVLEDEQDEKFNPFTSLSLFPRGKHVSSIKRSLTLEPARKFLPRSLKRVRSDGNPLTEGTLTDVKNLVQLLPAFLADNYHTWIRVGMILSNVGNGGVEALDIWHEFSKKSIKYCDKVCHDKWNRFHKDGALHIGTLHYLAKLHNPEGYATYLKKEFIRKLKTLRTPHGLIARMIHDEYKDIFVSTGSKMDEWYHFNGQSWIACPRAYTLSQLIQNLLEKRIYECLDDLRQEKIKLTKYIQQMKNASHSDEEGPLYSDEEDPDEEEKIRQAAKITKMKEELAHIDKAKAYLEKYKHEIFTKSYSMGVLHFCQELFYKKDFDMILNSKKHLLGCTNGVLDAQTGKFRKGKAEDYISTIAPFSYNPDNEYYEEHPEVLEVQEFFKKVFPDPELRQYFIDRQCQIFMGGNLQKVIEIWSGFAHGGKSTVATLMKKMLGKLACTIPVTFATGERTASSSATPELSQLGEGARKAFLQEPNAEKKLNVGALKELSGNDTMYVRGLYKNGKVIKIMADIVMMCNTIPRLSVRDDAIADRLMYIPFESKFTDDAPEDPEEQWKQRHFPKDHYIEDKMPGMVNAFAWILFQRWNEIKHDLRQIHVPAKVKSCTRAYINENDLFARFKHEQLEECKNDHVDILSLYVEYKDWFKEGYSGKHVNKDVFIREMTRVFKCVPSPLPGKKRLLGWKGWRIFKEEEEDNSEQEKE
jgi:phage/plasmid-associated DNA primase